MDRIEALPDQAITEMGAVSRRFLALRIDRFRDACRYVRAMPYGYNADRDNAMSLFEEGMGTCTTKHAVIALLAEELSLPVVKHICIYAMTESLVTGTDSILAKYNFPYVPMIHCFLASAGGHRVDLTEGNANGKNLPIHTCVHHEPVSPTISAKAEYLIYRRVLTDEIMPLPEFQDIPAATVLKARTEGLALLKANI